MKGRINWFLGLTFLILLALPAYGQVPVCGNRVCEPSENYFNCPSDCPPVEYQACVSELQQFKDSLSVKYSKPEMQQGVVTPEKQAAYDADHETYLKREAVCRALLPPVAETYDSCVQSYLDQASRLESRQDLEGAKRMRAEGYQTCGQKYCRPIPPPKTLTAYDKCIREGTLAISPLFNFSAEKELARKCEPLKSTLPEQSPEYQACIAQYKQMTVQWNTYEQKGVPFPPGFLKQYQEQTDKCNLLLGWTLALGCVKLEVPPQLLPPAQPGVEERLAAVEKQVKEQGSLIQRILNYLKRFFGG